MKLLESCYHKLRLCHAASPVAREMYYYVQWVGHYVCTPEFYIDRVNLNSYLLLFTLRGRGVLNYGGKTYNILPNTIMFIDCRKAHEYYTDGDIWDFKYIHFSGADSKKCYKKITEMYGSYVFDCDSETALCFDGVSRSISEQVSEEVLSEQMYHILMKLIRMCSIEKTRNMSAMWIRDTLSYISENYTLPLDINSLADRVHMNRSYFQTAFKQAVGTPPHKYITQYRIEAAKQLLYTTQYTVSEIAEKCGFADASTFVRTFKRAEGISPLKFRAINRP